MLSCLYNQNFYDWKGLLYVEAGPLLTHWGRVTHIWCISRTATIVSDNGLSPGWRQAIIWTNAGILLNGPLGTNFCGMLIGIQTFSFKRMLLKMASVKWRPFCLDLHVLIPHSLRDCQYNSQNYPGELGQYTPLLEQRREYTRTRSIHPTPGAEAGIYQN